MSIFLVQPSLLYASTLVSYSQALSVKPKVVRLSRDFANSRLLPRRLSVSKGINRIARAVEGNYPQQGAQSVEDPELLQLSKDATFVRRLGWISFWIQLPLSVVSAVILTFSITVRKDGMPPVSTWLALLGAVTAFLSTFFAWLSRRRAGQLASLQEHTPKQLISWLETAVRVNTLGLGATIAALQAEVGSLLSKTLSASSANPYVARPDTAPVAFDVFTVQASTNIVMTHFVSILFTNWMLSVLNERLQKMAFRTAQ